MEWFAASSPMLGLFGVESASSGSCARIIGYCALSFSDSASITSIHSMKSFDMSKVLKFSNNKSKYALFYPQKSLSSRSIVED